MHHQLAIGLLTLASLEIKGEKRPPSVPMIRRAKYDAGRNDPCPCQSGKKFKRCCIDATVIEPLKKEEA